MSSLTPRPPYSREELERLYPSGLQLQLVQVAGLDPHWPYCASARRFTNAVLSSVKGEQWDDFKWIRQIETFGKNGAPVLAVSKHGNSHEICLPGELTDLGRESTLGLGQRLRHLYVDQLGFMPETISDPGTIYLRATPVPRALESLQQAFTGLYPSGARAPTFPPPTIISRSPAEETLFPNDTMCARFGQLSVAYSKRAAERWNDSEEMAYISRTIGKWMPQHKVAVDSSPSLIGVMDTINATDAHGPHTKLPSAFYDAKMKAYMDQIAVEEWFLGYKESKEYRMLGIGRLMGDIVTRMTESVETRRELSATQEGRTVSNGTRSGIKLAMSGCHDTTLAATLASLGCYEGKPWPFFTSHIAIELFKKQASTSVTESTGPSVVAPSSSSIWSRFFSWNTANADESIGSIPLDQLSLSQKRKLDDHYVRIRYNDEVVKIPGCAAAGKHLEGDDSFCTLEAFKAVVDKYTPSDWKSACRMNLTASAFPNELEAAGYS